jgi:hypothetical protein
MTLNSRIVAAAVATIMFAGIFFSSLMGWWQTESSKAAAVYTSGEFAGQANPADIRGSYTFGDVEKNFSVPADELAKAFDVKTDNPSGVAVKSLETAFAGSAEEIGTGSVRLFVAFSKGLPYDLTTDTYLPESAAAILRTRPLTAEQSAYLQTHTVPNPTSQTATTAAPQPAPTEAPQGTSPAKPPITPQATAHPAGSTDPGLTHTVVGKTTFADLTGWGLPKEIIEQVLGKPMPAAAGMTIKDFCTQNGLSFETIKPALQAEVDRIK